MKIVSHKSFFVLFKLLISGVKPSIVKHNIMPQHVRTNIKLGNKEKRIKIEIGFTFYLRPFNLVYLENH